jgi:hypothetical protein
LVIGTNVAAINSPAFTGAPTAPTAAPGTNTTQIATTAFALANAKPSRYLQYAASTTWTKPAGLVGILIRIKGASGGGGAAGSSSAAQGGDGGGATLATKYVPAASLGATETVTVGAAGVGATGTGSNGTAGGTTALGSLLSVTGGGGGASSTGSAGVSGAAGVSTGHDVQWLGDVRIGAGNVKGTPNPGTLQNGFNATAGTGNAGTGGLSGAGGGMRTGGNGDAALIEVWEFY